MNSTSLQCNRDATAAEPPRRVGGARAARVTYDERVDTLVQWLPWLIGIIVAFLVVRFVVGLAVRLIGIAIIVAVAYFAWQYLTAP